VPLMNSFYKHHRDSIRWHYRCFDRILLNGLIQPFQQPERVVGFFNTYRQLYPVSRHTLRDTAEQFQRWLKGWSEKRNIPVAEAPKGRTSPQRVIHAASPPGPPRPLRDFRSQIIVQALSHLQMPRRTASAKKQTSLIANLPDHAKIV
jgi:hypothetical protein